MLTELSEYNVWLIDEARVIPLYAGPKIKSYSIVFSIIHLAPGDPAAIMAGEDADYEQVEAMRESMGLLDPIPVQFWRFVSGVAQGDLGESIF